MKRYAITLLTGTLLLLITSCGNKENGETTVTDTSSITTTPAETTVPPSGATPTESTDTTAIRPIDASMDSAAKNSTMPPK